MEDKALSEEVSDKLSSDELAWQAFVVSMVTVGAFIVVVFIFIL